jgi:hypothetical protein
MNQRRRRKTASLEAAKLLTRAAVVVAVVVAAILLLGGTANADVGVRQGRHGDSGRVVFDFPGIETTHTKLVGQVLTIRFSPALPMASEPLGVPGFETLQGGDGLVELRLAKNAVARVYRIGDRIVVDARPRTPGGTRQPVSESDAPPRPLPAATAPVQQPAPMASRQPGRLSAVSPQADSPSVVAPQVVSPQAGGPTAGGPMAGSPQAGSPQAGSLPGGAQPVAASPASAAINFTSQPGAAAFRRGNNAVLIFDTDEIPDITGLQSTPAFANAVLVSQQNAQIITMPLPAAQALAVTPVSGGWQVAAVSAAQSTVPAAQAQTTKIEFPMPSASTTVTIADPLTGSDLLVGTVTQGNAAANFAQSGPGFSVLPSWLGVAVMPQADNLGLSITPTGFELSSAARGGLPLGILPLSASGAAQQPAFGPGLRLPNGDTAALRERMLSDMRTAATLPALGRLSAQIALARDMIALGLGPEAKGVLATAVLENPAAQDNSQIAGMRAVAGVLAGKYTATDFSAAGITPSSEISFWQAVGEVQQGATLQAAPALAANLALFEAYPAALRDCMAAGIGEALVDAGQLQAAQQLVSSDPANPLLNMTRAKLLERQGQMAAALAAYQRLSQTGDTRISALAGDRAVELQLAAGRLTPAQAADRLDAALFDWRAPEHERHMRLRIAQLRAAAGQWPQAFTMLQSARTSFPDQQSAIDAVRAAMFVNMLSSNQFAQLPPIQAVAILQQNQDLIPAGAGSANVIDLLAQRLDALDLPGAAAPMLSHLIKTIPQGAARASLGARLAQVDLDAGSPVASLADLAQTESENLPPELAAQRRLLKAESQAGAGNAVAAVTNLAPVARAAAPTDPNALQTQAQIAEQSGQWPQAERALGVLVSQSVPATGPINGDPENLLLRLATAASHNGDTAMLGSLSQTYGARIGADAAGQMFHTLTTPALTGDQGLTQALKEISQLQALPAMVDAVAAAPQLHKTQVPGPAGTP